MQDSKYTAYKALVITAKDDRNEALVLIRKYELEAKIIVRRNLTKVISNSLSSFSNSLLFFLC